MGFNICWWRYLPNAGQDHDATYSKLMGGQDCPELETLPIDEIRARIADAFSDTWEQIGPDSWQGEKGMGELYITEKCINLTGYGDLGEDLGVLVDIMTEFNCPAFDPQSGDRHGRELYA